MTTAVIALENITDEMVMKTLQEVVSEKPEYVYSSPEHQKGEIGTCFYVHTDEDGAPVSPGCVVGVVLHRVGVPLEVLKKEEGWPARAAIRHIGLGLSFETKTTLTCIQNYQDSKETWGEAYAMATGETI